jgi:uncharacterized protein (DUF433 family)
MRELWKARISQSSSQGAGAITSALFYNRFTTQPWRVKMITDSGAAAANNFDPRNEPAYTVAEASRYLKVASTTLRSWVVGRPYPKAEGVGKFEPLIQPPRTQPVLLSFWNLIEVHVLRALRTDHAVSIQAVREALSFAEERLRIERLLLGRQFCADGGQLFLKRYGELIHLRPSGHLVLQHLFEQHLERVEWDENQFPIRLFPFMRADPVSAEWLIAIDANVAFGRPVVARAGISTAAILDRIDVGEQVTVMAEDYDLSPDEITQAVLYERAA